VLKSAVGGKEGGCQALFEKSGAVQGDGSLVQHHEGGEAKRIGRRSVSREYGIVGYLTGISTKDRERLEGGGERGGELSLTLKKNSVRYGC